MDVGEQTAAVAMVRQQLPPDRRCHARYCVRHINVELVDLGYLWWVSPSMSDRRIPLADLPFWPLLLGREEAARYVGVSADVFDDEVACGMWPPPMRRGTKGGRLTWHRPSLDASAARETGLDERDAGTASPTTADGLWKERSNATAKEDRSQGRSKKTG
jgi:hypothetical protein